MRSAKRCPECGKIFHVAAEQSEEAVRCPQCQSQIGESHRYGEGRSRGRASAIGPNPSYRRPNGTNVSLILSFILGAVLACGVFAVMWYEFEGTYVHAILTQRGWVPYAIILLACWAAALLVFKYRKIRRQRKALSLDLLPVSIGVDIRPSNAGRFREHFHNLRCDANHNFLVKRIARALDYFEANHPVDEVAGLLKSHAETDASCVQASYTILKVIVWAIPILGFLGTVIGIGMAVAQFSVSLEGLQVGGQITELLGPVIGGLAVAFDTTLLALLMSLVIMFPTSALEKMEDDLLIAVDEYCHDRFLSRLQGADAQAVSQQEGFQNAMAGLLEQHQSQLEAWSQKLGSIGTQISTQVAQGWDLIHQKLCAAQDASLHQVQEISARLTRTQADLTGKFETVLNDQVDQCKGAVAALVENMHAFGQQAHEDCRSETKVVQGMAGQLGASLSGMQEQLQAIQKDQTTYLQEATATLTDRLGQLQEKVHEDHCSDARTMQEMADKLHVTVQRVQKQVEVSQDVQAGQFKDLVAALTENLQTLQQQVHEDYCSEAKVVQGMAEQLGRAITGAKDEGQAMQAAMSGAVTGCEEVLRHVDQACVTLTEHMKRTGERLTELDAARESTIEKVVRRLADEHAPISKALRDQLRHIGKVNEQSIVILSRYREQLRREMGESAEARQEMKEVVKSVTGLQGLDGKLATITRMLNALGVLIKRSAGHTTGTKPQTVVPLHQGGSARRSGLRQLWKGGGNGSRK